jgi:flagellar hook-associated protein 3 FlgL
MITRVTTLMTSQQLLSNINASQDALAETEEQLSTGKRINQPSDDPYGASLAVQLDGELGQLQSYAANASDGQSFAAAGMSALSSITQQLQRAQELVTEANNGTMSTTELQSAGAEINQLIAGIKSDANTQYDGQYVFAGGGQTTPPWSSSSDAFAGVTGGTVQRTIASGGAATSRVTVNAQLYTVLNGADDQDDGLLGQLSSIATSLQNGTAPGPTALTDLAGSLSGLENLSAGLGAASDRLQIAADRIASLQTSTTAALGDDQDVNMAQALTTYSNEQAAFTAALKAGANIVQTSLMDFLST